MAHTARGTALTPAMKIAIAVIGVLVVAGIVVIAMLNTAGRDGAEAPPSSAPTTAVAPPTTPGPLPGATPTTGSEVPPPTAAPGTGLPPLAAAAPLVAAPLPKSGSRDGGLVAGFPTSVAEPMEDSDVVSTSIATENTAMQVSLVSSTTTALDEIRAHYRALWTSLGLREQPGDDSTMAFTGEFESLTLNVRTTGTGNMYTIFGVLRTE